MRVHNLFLWLKGNSDRILLEYIIIKFNIAKIGVNDINFIYLSIENYWKNNFTLAVKYSVLRLRKKENFVKKIYKQMKKEVRQ